MECTKQITKRNKNKLTVYILSALHIYVSELQMFVKLRLWNILMLTNHVQTLLALFGLKHLLHTVENCSALFFAWFVERHGVQNDAKTKEIV